MCDPSHLTLRIKPYIQPFERELAYKELKALVGESGRIIAAEDDGRCFQVIGASVAADDLADRLAYWEWVCSSDPIWTRQIRREATANVVRNGGEPSELITRLPFNSDSLPVPNHRCLRYGPHAIHEYRGRFFPQLVRALLNCARIVPRSVVLDPMCGSGTTLVEAALADCEAIGLDLNPLSILIAKTKCSILETSPGQIIGEYDRMREVLMTPVGRRHNAALPYLSSLPARDQQYLSRWFAPDTLTDLDSIACIVHDMPPSAIRDLFLVCLSNILRSVSWQKTDDLRIRREVKPNDRTNAIAEYLSQLGRTVRSIVAFLAEERGEHRRGRWETIRGDAREISRILEGRRGLVDVVITSPPYAMALPYLDTDRLSLSYLGLLSREWHRGTEAEMIGNREITAGLRSRLWREYRAAQSELPGEVCRVIDLVHDAYEKADVGFRRKNLPALLSKYFGDMAVVLNGVRGLMKPGGDVFVVVGDNHTMAGERRIDIETGRLMGIIGEAAGLEIVESTPMDMLAPRGIFRKNSVASERIIRFQA